MSPRVRYQTLELGEVDFHLRTLRDCNEFCDPHGEAEALGIGEAVWPLFGVLWEMGEALARVMWEWQIEGKRVLEVGCGIGLTSIVLAHRGADIMASDWNPEAEVFLKYNMALNDVAMIPFVRADWNDVHPDLGRFDLIVGSDLLYDPSGPEALSGFLERHANPSCEVVILDPGRRRTGKFGRLLGAQGYSCESSPAPEIGGRSGGRMWVYRRLMPQEQG